MAEKKIDYNRGLMKRTHIKTGVDVYMYKDDPGVFLNAYGTVVSEQLARECGFETEKLGKEKLKKERMAQAMALIEAELAEAEPSNRLLVEERLGFKVMDVGKGMHILEDPDGNKLTAAPLPMEAALTLLKQMTPEYEAPAKQQPPVIWTKPDPVEDVQVVTTLEKNVKPMNFGEKMKAAKEAKKSKQ